MSRYRKSNQKIRYAVVGLGHLAQVAVLPAFKKAPIVNWPHRPRHNKPKTVNVQSPSGE
jgi:hypothetical protein